jgi:predicted outer membrane repeat protein
MRYTNIITGAVMAAISSTMFADTILVPSEYGSIQSGIDVAVEGDIVSVEPGIYYETINFLGKAITVSSSSGDPSGTFIDGALVDESVVKFVTAETETSILDGFTIRNGSAVDGGGVLLLSATPTIQNCIISGNNASRFGGGIFADTSRVTLTDVAITGNVSTKTGAGIYMVYSQGSITGGSISNNSGTSGAGVYIKKGAGSLSITDVMFSENIGSNNGGAIYNKSSSITVQSCTFDMNSATADGGAFYSYSGGTSTFSDSQFLNNTAGDGGGAANLRGSTGSFSQCTFDGNIADSDCDGVGESGVMEIHASSVTLENPTICTNLICDVIGDFSEEQPIIIGDILGCSSGEGACCGGTACWVMSYTDCLDGGGIWGGEETICAMVDCYSATAGACCLQNTCVMTATSGACEDGGGTFEGELIECEDIVCVGCPADLNGDGSVEVNDIIEVIASWGACP